MNLLVEQIEALSSLMTVTAPYSGLSMAAYSFEGSGAMTEGRILVVEDEAIAAKSIESNLDKLGYAVVGRVSSGDGAVRLAGETQPDLVLMDIKLQGDTDGIAAAELIRTRYHIPVVYLTAHADEETLGRAKITQPFGYVLKPFDLRDLHVAIEMARYLHAMDQERERLVAELQEAVAQVKTLRGLIPICMNCKKIRDDEGYWHQLEVYIRDHSEAEFSHGLCSECARKMYPDYFGDKKE